MLYKDTGRIKEKMNEYGKKQLPFVFILNFEMTEGYFIESPLEQSDIYFQIHGKGNKSFLKKKENMSFFTFRPIPRDEYHKKFQIVRNGLLRGDSFLTNLTVKIPVETNLSLSGIFQLSQAPFQLLVPDQFVSFSPECFVSIRNGRISTYPMKGTIDANIPDAEEIILNDSKEIAEHNTIVDLLRNDLSRVATKVTVKRFRYVEKIFTNKKDILQVSSEITGDLPVNYHSHLGDIIFGMLPAGSVSGAPKASTLEIIRSAEKETRGYYTGIFGYYDGNALESGVLIRFIEKDREQLFFRSGGGITAYSDPEKEYQEILNKIYLPFIS